MTVHVEGRLSAYLDSELPAAERAAVEEHLGACADCARRLEQLAAVDEAARALALEVPAGYFEGFPVRLRAHLGPPKRTTWRLPVWSLAVAATLLLVAVTPALLPRAARAPAREAELPAASRQLAQEPAAKPAAPPATLPEAKQDALKALGYLGDAKAPVAPAEKTRKRASPAFAADASIEPGLAGSPAPPAPVVAAPATQAPREAFALEPQGRPASSGAEQRAEADVAGRERAQEAKAQEGLGRSAPLPGAMGAASTALRKKPLAEAHFARLLARGTAGSPAEALATREAWRGFVREHPADTRTDEARVHVIEAGVALYRLSHDPRDLESVRQDAAVYLTREDALLAARVRALLRELER